MKSIYPTAKRLSAIFQGEVITGATLQGMTRGTRYELVVCQKEGQSFLVFAKNNGKLRWRFEYYSDASFCNDWLFRSVIIEKTGHNFINTNLLPNYFTEKTEKIKSAK